nr:mechanosensitive ion channel domain-containing protein [Kofleriaceae bacterium]
MTISTDDLRSFADEYLLPFGLHILIALAIFVGGRWIARLMIRGIDRVMARSHVDVSLRKFTRDIIYAMLLVIVLVAALDSLGVKTTAVVAALGAAGIAVGLALQGSLSNFAAGVMLIVLRPYKVSDLVAIGKYTGRVDAIKVFNTILVTADHREITIPNGLIIAQPIENLTVLGRRRIDLIVTINQTATLGDVKATLADAIRDDKIHNDPVAAIEVAEITDASIKLYVRPWADADDYAAVSTAAIERVKAALEASSLKFSIAMAPP